MPFAVDELTSDTIDASVVANSTPYPFYQPMHVEHVSDDDLSDVDDILQGPSDRISPPLASDSESDSAADLKELLDIAEPKKVKSKERPRGSKNKKGTKAEKKAAKSTKRDPSGFEYVEQAMKTRNKRVKKKAAVKQATQGQDATEERVTSRTEGRGGQGGSGRGRGRPRKNTIAAKSKAIAVKGKVKDQPIEVSSDSESSEEEKSDDGFRDLEGNDSEKDSDEAFRESMHEDYEHEDD